MQCKEKPSLDKWFSLHFSSRSTITARLDEELIVSTFYTNQDVVDLLGQELCIAIDVALAGSCCEAVVEGFFLQRCWCAQEVWWPVKQVSYRACNWRLVFTPPSLLSSNDENNCQHLFPRESKASPTKAWDSGLH